MLSSSVHLEDSPLTLDQMENLRDEDVCSEAFLMEVIRLAESAATAHRKVYHERGSRNGFRHRSLVLSKLRVLEKVISQGGVLLTSEEADALIERLGDKATPDPPSHFNLGLQKLTQRDLG